MNYEERCRMAKQKIEPILQEYKLEADFTFKDASEEDA